MYIITTSKVGEYTTEVGDGLTLVKQYDYFFYGKKRAEFHIVKVESQTARVDITETGENAVKNTIPIKFFESFDNVLDATRELQHLAGSKSMDVALKERPATPRS